MTIWDGISGRGRECTDWMKVVLLTQVDGCVRVWRPRNTAFLEEHIVCTTAFGVTVWGCLSLNCKLDLYVLDGTLTGQMYRD